MVVGEAPKWSDKDDKDAKDEMFYVPGEIVSRRAKKVTKEEVQQIKEETITLDWDDIFPKKPKDRLRWLFKALEGIKNNKIKANPVFDIVTHRKFIDGLQGSVATDVLNLIRGNLSVFSNKQQKQLTSDNFTLFRKFAPINVLDSDDDEADAPPLPPPPDVVVEMKEKKKNRNGDDERRRREEREREEEEAAYRSDEDVETKRRRILSKGVERRVDPADGQAYTLEDFVAEYGGRLDAPPDQWDAAKLTSFIYKS